MSHKDLPCMVTSGNAQDLGEPIEGYFKQIHPITTLLLTLILLCYLSLDEHELSTQTDASMATQNRPWLWATTTRLRNSCFRFCMASSLAWPSWHSWRKKSRQAFLSSWYQSRFKCLASCGGESWHRWVAGTKILIACWPSFKDWNILGQNEAHISLHK